MNKLKSQSAKRKVSRRKIKITAGSRKAGKVQNLKFLVLSFSFALYTLHFALPCFAQDKIVAIVNKDIITQKDLESFSNFMRMQLSQELSGKELDEKVKSMKPDILNKLIEDRLIVQEAKKNKIEIDDGLVQSRIMEIKKRYRTDADFYNDILRQGMTQADIEAKIREQLLMYRVIGQKIRSKIVISPEDITKYYRDHSEEFNSGEKREVVMVTLDNEDLAKTFAFNLRSGEKVEDLAARYPVVVDNLNIRQGELRKEIEDVVFKLGIDEVSNPVKLGNKYYVFKLISTVQSQQLKLTEVQDKIKDFLFDKKLQGELDKWLNELKQKAYIKILQS